MHLVCYAFSAIALPNLEQQIARLARRLPLTELIVVYRESAISSGSIEHLGARTGIAKLQILPYDGRTWEFGAYQRGLDQLPPSGNGVVLLNDTVGQNYPLFKAELLRFSASAIQACHSEVPIAAGCMEAKNQDFSLCGLRCDRWIRSNLFYLNDAALNAIGHRLFEPDVFTAPRVTNGLLSINLPVSPELSQYIRSWMAPVPSKHNWLGHTGRAAAPDELLRAKTGSILLEKRLSSRLLAKNGQLLRSNLAESRWYRLRLRLFLKLRRIQS